MLAAIKHNAAEILFLGKHHIRERERERENLLAK